MSDKTVRVESNPSPRYFFGGKDGRYWPFGHACCVLSSFFYNFDI